MENTTINKNPKVFYFEMNDGNYILPASFFKRFFGRLLDIIIYTTLGGIFIGIGFSNSFGNLSNIQISETFSKYMPSAYDAWFLVGTITILASTVFFGIIYPLVINKKYLGQTLGKKALGITPMYLNEKYRPKRDYLIREIPLIMLILLITTLMLISGYNFELSWNYYNLFQAQQADNLGTDFTAVSFWDFVSQSGSQDIMGTSSFQQFLGHTSVILNPLQWFTNLVILFSIAFGFKKRGLHDKMANTAIVDLKTVTSLEYFQDNYSESDVNPVMSEEMDDSSNLVINNFEFESERILPPESSEEKDFLRFDDNDLKPNDSKLETEIQSKSEIDQSVNLEIDENLIQKKVLETEKEILEEIENIK